MEKDEEYIRQVKALGDAVEHSIMQNIAVDIYQVHKPLSNQKHPARPAPQSCAAMPQSPGCSRRAGLRTPRRYALPRPRPQSGSVKRLSPPPLLQDYFEGEFHDHSSEPPSAKTLSVFKDPNQIKRTVTSISWFPDGGKKLAVSLAMMQFQDWRMDKMSPKSYIWDVNNPNFPEQELVPASPLCCLRYNPKDPHLLVGGSYNGLVSYWDTRRGDTPMDTSIIEKSHRDPVYDIWWLQGKTAYECASTSTDGQVRTPLPIT